MQKEGVIIHMRRTRRLKCKPEKGVYTVYSPYTAVDRCVQTPGYETHKPTLIAWRLMSDTGLPHLLLGQSIHWPVACARAFSLS